jgi:uncharacterized phage-associated protein
MDTKSVFDVAVYILTEIGPTTAMKLQKLCYYAQAWSLVWDAKPLFSERIEAWANGPVCPVLYDVHRGSFEVSADLFKERGDASRFSADERATMDEVIRYYGSKSPFWLSELTHAEDPWKDARNGMSPGERGNVEITHAAMAEYYGSL